MNNGSTMRWSGFGRGRMALVLMGVSLLFLLSVTFPSSGVWAEANTRFYRTLYDKPHTTFQDAVIAVAILLTQDNSLTDFERARQTLLDYHVLTHEEITSYQKNTPLRYGLAAYLVFRALKLKGGWITRLFGVNQRYALRECIFLNLVRQETSAKYVSGEELLSILFRAKKYRDQLRKEREKRKKVRSNLKKEKGK